MKKFKLIKIVTSSLLVLLCTFSSIKAQAVTDRQIIVAHEQTVYADSYQWRKEGNTWMCGTPDLHQAYYNAWICTNGSWYYVNQYGQMVTNVWVNNYYVNDNGQWVVNARRNPGSHEIQGLY
ncbi:MAG: hypothetical protein LKH93_19775 [Clostridium beijerinckii]|jgi:hypothetical protein|nr:hypothetical protein [Clostridium beijerinckii]MCI1578969.1 hypothetical protein [Clostridium beijerinckii]MCI1585065.1 hypothetical protein [Clostridium beijerinckii]MCI1624414.1 hypothetical protein [Clostridium beijerinckii]